MAYFFAFAINLLSTFDSLPDPEDAATYIIENLEAG
jgi:hypothetical protein